MSVDERFPVERPVRPASVDVALNMCLEANSEVTLPTPMCWDLALYVARLEAFAAVGAMEVK